MKKIIRAAFLGAAAFLLVTGCGKDVGTGHTGQANNVEAVINSQVDKEDREEEKEIADTADTDNAEAIPDVVSETEEPTQMISEKKSETADPQQNVSDNIPEQDDPQEKICENGEDGEKDNGQEDSGVDYDLTQMSKDMVYASIWQLMMYPEEYVGKTFKMSGIYYSSYYEPTGQYYYYCLISDAAACCAQGIEFIWEDGSHKYPDEYPEETSEIVITGTFETYQEDNDPNLYCRLNNATLETK